MSLNSAIRKYRSLVFWNLNLTLPNGGTFAKKLQLPIRKQISREKRRRTEDETYIRVIQILLLLLQSLPAAL